MSRSSELFLQLREEEVHQSEEYQNYLKLAYLRDLNTSTGTKTYQEQESVLNQIKTTKTENGNGY